MIAGPGGLILVVGPSGCGKDTLLREAARLLRGNENVHFPRRMITRPADPDNENHIPIARAQFEKLRDESSCAFCWEAHGYGYALPDALVQHVESGRAAVFNASRGILQQAAERFEKVVAVYVEVPSDLLEQRLKGRARESATEIEARLKRPGAPVPTSIAVKTIVNDGAPREGGEKLATLITRFFED